jgi:hypothetical protein|tara:strand:- start:1991 stop:2296 length:306 start_codon:yes stop_codon:yes gene_type:complete
MIHRIYDDLRSGTTYPSWLISRCIELKCTSVNRKYDFARFSADLKHRQRIDGPEKVALNCITNFQINLKRALSWESEVPYLGSKFWREHRKLRKFRSRLRS